ncbi:hypothetical protein [Streptomyces sp. T028]|uniref:hypothetical protein n=1 Tax=Streptomyces sp. T028 TaxID=3394379 RepID=UPI003A8B832D
MVPRLCDHPQGIDLSQQQTEMSANAILTALAALGDPAAVPVLVDTLGAALRQEQDRATRSALAALGAFGPAAAGARRRSGHNDDALVRLVTAVLFELHDEWIAFPRRHLPEGSMGDIYRELPESAPALPNTPNTPTS